MKQPGSPHFLPYGDGGNESVDYSGGGQTVASRRGSKVPSLRLLKTGDTDSTIFTGNSSYHSAESGPNPDLYNRWLCHNLLPGKRISRGGLGTPSVGSLTGRNAATASLSGHSVWYGEATGEERTVPFIINNAILGWKLTTPREKRVVEK